MSLIKRTTSQTITRPADTTAYADLDLVANSTTPGSVTPFVWEPRGGYAQMRVQSAIVNKSTGTTANGSFRLWLFTTLPTVANGDNSALVPVVMTGFIGTLSGAATFGGSTTARTPLGVDTQGAIWPSNNTLYGLLEAKAAYVPGSEETFSVELILALEA